MRLSGLKKGVVDYDRNGEVYWNKKKKLKNNIFSLWGLLKIACVCTPHNSIPMRVMAQHRLGVTTT